MRITSLTFFFAAVVVATSSLVFSPATALAEVTSSIRIDQVSPKATGSWVLYSANDTVHSSTDPGFDKNSYSFSISHFGPTTFSVTPPAGMAAKITVYQNGVVKSIVDMPQYSFTLYPNENYRLLVQYAFTRLGSLGITSEPSDVRFRMIGPSGKVYSQKTPYTFTNIPAGQYTVQVGATKGCTQPPRHTAVVAPDQRTTVNITLVCGSTASSTSAAYTPRPTKRSLVEYVEQRELNSRGNRK